MNPFGRSQGAETDPVSQCSLVPMAKGLDSSPLIGMEKAALTQGWRKEGEKISGLPGTVYGQAMNLRAIIDAALTGLILLPPSLRSQGQRQQFHDLMWGEGKGKLGSSLMGSPSLPLPSSVPPERRCAEELLCRVTKPAWFEPGEAR